MGGGEGKWERGWVWGGESEREGGGGKGKVGERVGVREGKVGGREGMNEQFTECVSHLSSPWVVRSPRSLLSSQQTAKPSGR